MKTNTPSQLIQVTALTLAIGVLSPLSFTQEETNEEAVATLPWTQADTKLANHYIRLLEKNPEYGNVLDLLWSLYDKKNQTGLLLNYFQSASESETAPAVAILIHAHLLRKGEDLNAAREAYDRVTDIDPENIQALLALAEIADLQKRSGKALSLYTRLVEKLPTASEEGLAIRLRKATLHQQLGQLDNAIEIWKKLLTAYPNKPALRTEIVSLLLETGETDTAIGVLTALADSEEPRQQLNALTELNRIYAFISNFDGAAEAGRQALKLLHFKSEEYALLFERVVQLHEQFERLDVLETSLASAVSEENPTEKSLHDLASFYALTADSVKEEEILERLVERLPSDLNYRLSLARTQLRNDRFNEAAATLDGVIEESSRPPLNLILLRAEISLNAEDRMEAENILTDHLETSVPDPETLATVIDFARTNYLDGLVERLLLSTAKQENAGPPAELARFLNERGRKEQAIAILNEYANRSSSAEKKDRMVQITAVLRDLGQTEEALNSIGEALEISPMDIDLIETRAAILVENGQVEEAIELLNQIWEHVETVDKKSQIDQRLFSLLRGHFNNDSEPFEDPSVLSGGNIQTLAQYRKMAVVANKAHHPGDEPPPEELMSFYEDIKKAADTTKTLTKRYRAAWWAFKLQDNHECYAQLTTAKEEAGRPILEVEQMLLSLAELNERTTLMVDHLTTLAEIDPDNADEYLQRRAEMRFELGFEDEAIRELKSLAAKPEAALTTLSALAKVYARQGNSGKQIEVWQQAYRQANSFEKRRIIKQLSTVLIENERPEEALAAQLELLERESDTIQRRKLLDNQLNLARTHFLLEWMLERVQALTQQHPFDRFYPEALARIQQATGDTAGAFASLKKAYYMSEHNDGLLGELSALADELGDLKSAIYYRRQLLSRSEGDQLENWQILLTMLEKDLRLDEANLLRRRLENCFGRDPGFLSELAVHYKQDGQRADTQRVLAKIVQLRDWDLQARFRLALIQSERGYHSEALANFLHVIDHTPEVVYPRSFHQFARPLIRVARLDDDAKTDSGNELHSFVIIVEDFPYLGGSMQDEIAAALLANHREYQYLPAKPLWLRIRAIEEAAALSAVTGQTDTWLARWKESDRPDVEKLWAYRYLNLSENEEAHGRYGALVESMPESGSFINLFQGAYARLLAGDVDALYAWINNPEASVGRHDRVACLSMAALVLLTDPIVGAEISKDFIYEVISEMPYLDKFGAYLFAELREKGFLDEAFSIGSLTADAMETPDVSFLFSLSQVAGQTGRERARVKALDRTLAAMEPGESVRSRDLFLSALTERLSLMDSDEPREKRINRLLRETDAPEPISQGNNDEKKLLIQIAGNRYDDAIKTLGKVTSRQIDFIRPRDPDPDQVRYIQIQSWQRMDQLLRYYSARIPQNLKYGSPFADAMRGNTLALPVDDSAISQFEQFEIGCRTLPLEWLSATERSVLVANIESQLVDPNSRFELGKSLETQGFHREAVQVFQAEVRRRGKNYAPMQSLFDACETALDPGPALDVIHRIGTREYNPPPGITSDYIAEQHARFLAISRDIDRLVPLSRKPTGSHGAPPITTEAHLPFQSALIEAYRQSGEEDALLRLLTHLRNTNEIENLHLLLGAELLQKQDKSEAALEWLKDIPLNGDDSELERKAMTQLAKLYQNNDTQDLDALVQLAHNSLESQPHSVVLTLALAVGEAGAVEQADALFTLIRRNTSDRSNRFFTSLSLLLTKHQVGIPLVEMQNEWETIFHDFDYNDTSVNSAGLPESNAAHLVRWMIDLTEPSAELARRIEETPVPAQAAWLQQLILAWNLDQLEFTASELLANADRTGRDRILATLPAFGESGINAARNFVQANASPGTHYFANHPQQQILFFHRISDRPRLLEVHARFMQEAESDIFRQAGLKSGFATLLSRRKLPSLFYQLGEHDLAGRLFRRYNEQLTSYRWNHHLFLEDFATYLIETKQFNEAETLLHKVFQKSLSVDLRLLMQLYADWDKLDSWEDRTAELHLTTGRRILLREWRTALAEGREMVEYTGSW